MRFVMNMIGLMGGRSFFVLWSHFYITTRLCSTPSTSTSMHSGQYDEYSSRVALRENITGIREFFDEFVTPLGVLQIGTPRTVNCTVPQT